MSRHTEHVTSGHGNISGGRSSMYERIFTIFEAYSEGAAWNELNLAVSGLDTIVLNGVILYMSDKEVTPISDETYGLWKGRVEWRSPEHPKAQKTPEIDSSEYELDISGSNVKVLWAEEGNTRKYSITGNAADAPDLQGAINYKGGKNAPEGVDVIVPNLGYTETHYIDAAVIDENWVALARSTVGKTNLTSFRGFPPDEMLMIAIRGSRRQVDTMWKMTFEMAIGAHRTNIKVGDEDPDVPGRQLTVARKDAWEYLWIYDDKKEATGLVRPTPEYAYVHKLYESIEFDNIVPPTPF